MSISTDYDEFLDDKVVGYQDEANCSHTAISRIINTYQNRILGEKIASIGYKFEAIIDKKSSFWEPFIHFLIHPSEVHAPPQEPQRFEQIEFPKKGD